MNILKFLLVNKIFVLARIIIAAIKIDKDVNREDIWSVIIVYEVIDVNEYELNIDNEYVVSSIIIVNVTHHEYLHNMIRYIENIGNINFNICLLINYLLYLTHKSETLQLKFLTLNLLHMHQMLAELFWFVGIGVLRYRILKG